MGIATALLAGPWTRPLMHARLTAALGRRSAPRWVGALVDQVRDSYRDPPADRPRELASYLQTRPAWALAWQHRRVPRIVHWQPTPTAMVRAPWPLVELDDLSALCRLLDIDAGELAWFADARSLERRASEPLRHYRWRTLPKRDGVRLVAAPKPRLKEIQRRLLRHVMEPIPLHAAAHGCVRGLSVRTAVAPHSGSTVVFRFDLEAFFASIPAGRVWGLFRTAGLPEAVAHTLTGLVTTTVPLAVWREVQVPRDTDAHRRLGRQLAAPHLPQGAPTSPAVANSVAFSLDGRLAGLAAGFGAQYTRYVDDLTFSGGSSLRSARSRFRGVGRSDRARRGLSLQRTQDGRTRLVRSAAGARRCRQRPPDAAAARPRQPSRPPAQLRSARVAESGPRRGELPRPPARPGVVGEQPRPRVRCEAAQFVRRRRLGLRACR
jgi:RNA-directed DNA polymerase